MKNKENNKSLNLNDLIDRPIIRNDQIFEMLNKMTDEEIKDYYDSIEKQLEIDGVEKIFPVWNSERLSKEIDMEILYEIFKEERNKNKEA